MLTDFSISTFVTAFGPANSPRDMALYLSEEMSAAKILSEVEDSQNVFFLAWYHNVLVGYAKASYATKKDAPEGMNSLEIERLYVLQEYQSRRVGASLMSACLQLARENGRDAVWLGVWEHNLRAIAFYKREGFVKFGTHIFRLGTDEQTDILMMKSLK